MSMSPFGINATAQPNWIAMPEAWSRNGERGSDTLAERFSASTPGGWLAINLVVTLL